MLTAKKQAQIIANRVNDMFVPHVKARYHIEIVNNKYDKKYEFFFFKYRKGLIWPRSIPVRTVYNYDIEYLEQIVTELRNQTNLTIKFVAF